MTSEVGNEFELGESSVKDIQRTEEENAADEMDHFMKSVGKNTGARPFSTIIDKNKKNTFD